MRAWLITVGEPLPIDADQPRLLRTGALAQHLAARGHEVTWFTSAFDHTHKRLRRLGAEGCEQAGVRIELLKAAGYSSNISIARLRDQKVTASDFARRSRELDRPDVILCSLPTLDLCAAAASYHIERGVPLLLDIRDLWPDVYYRLAPAALEPLLRIVFRWQERLANEALKAATGLIGVSGGYLEWGLARAGRLRGVHDRVIPLGYVFRSLNSEELETAGRALASMGVEGSRPIAWYVGSFGRQYDLAPVIEAARRFHGQRNTPLFVISGTGEKEARWRRLAAGLDNVVFTGWITRPEIGWLRQHASIGLQPYIAGAPQGLANKTFEYLSAGLPVVSSLAGENSLLLENTGTGIFYRPGDGKACYSSIMRLLSNKEELAEMSRRAVETFETQFNSEAVFGALETALLRAANSQVERA